MGIRTTNLDVSSIVDELIGNYNGSTVRVSLLWLLAALTALQGPTFATQAELLADLDWPDGAQGYVTDDETPENNGRYRKDGASGAGTWTRIGDIPSGGPYAAELALKAPLASPALSGIPTTPTAAPGTDTTQIASTAFVQAALTALLDAAPGALDTLNELAAALNDDPNFAATMATALGLKAPLASPALTGTPTAPTATPGTNTTQLANTAFVQAALAALLDAAPGTLDTLNELAAALNDDPNFAATMATALGLKAPLASPALTGTPTAPTAAPGTSTTQLANTAFVQAAITALIAAAPGALDTLNELAAALGDDANFAATMATALGLKAPLADPALTGTPTAPTASPGTNTAQIATTEFVQEEAAKKLPSAVWDKIVSTYESPALLAPILPLVAANSVLDPILRLTVANAVVEPGAGFPGYSAVAAFDLGFTQAEVRLTRRTDPEGYAWTRRLSHQGRNAYSPLADTAVPGWVLQRSAYGVEWPVRLINAAAPGYDPERVSVIDSLGQSLATNVTGDSDGEDGWKAEIEHPAGTTISDRYLSFSSINDAGDASGGGTTIAAEVFQPAEFNWVGSPVASGGYTRSAGPDWARALAMVHSPWPIPNAGRVFLAEQGIGGQTITHFMKASSGGAGDYWDDVLIPTWTRIKSQADAAGYAIDRIILPWNQHEADHATGMSYADYKTLFDAFVADLEALRTSIFGAIEMYIVCVGGARIYEAGVTVPTGFTEYQVSAPRMVQIDAGLSDAIDYANVYHAPPSYNLPFGSISHQTYHGYRQVAAQTGDFIAHAIWAREVAGYKAKALHAASAVMNAAGTAVRIKWAPVPQTLGLTDAPDPAPSPYTGLPAKTNGGFSFHGGDAPPTVASIVTNAGLAETVITFSAAWTGTGRALGIAFQATDGAAYENRMQGWQTLDDTTATAWKHKAVGCNVHMHAGAACHLSGQGIVHYPLHQKISVS